MESVPTENRRKMRKASRACDRCKSKKTKCSGLLPCTNCATRGLPCVYDAKYSRGRPRTPPPGPVSLHGSTSGSYNEVDSSLSPTIHSSVEQPIARVTYGTPPAGPSQQRIHSRGSPDMEMAEIEGQYFDPTSLLTFLHRAWRRLLSQSDEVAHVGQSGTEKRQSVLTAGDRPFHAVTGDFVQSCDLSDALEKVNTYFDVCLATYRMFHRQTLAAWAEILVANAAHGVSWTEGLGSAKVAILLTICAIVERRQMKVRAGIVSEVEDVSPPVRIEGFFCAATRLTDSEVGLPRLESVQARLLQVLYLLQTSRMNQAWYTFGNVVQMISALGLHRRRGRIRYAGPASKVGTDYITEQCRKRTFWVAYTIDRYLAVVLGRPRHFSDDDIDQDFPDSVNDADMTASGPTKTAPAEDCHIDALICHAKLAQIIDKISRSVYSIQCIPRSQRLAAAHKYSKTLQEWRASLPPHLGTLRPNTLIPSFRRQAIALKLAHVHAVIHATRPFLLGGSEDTNGPDNSLKDAVKQCVEAARVALETVDTMASDGTLFHAFWWTHYLTFCALAVVYVWIIQRRESPSIPGGHGMASGPEDGTTAFAGVFDLAVRCEGHLSRATTRESPTKRYSVILQELRLEATRRTTSQLMPAMVLPEDGNQMPSMYPTHRGTVGAMNVAGRSLEREQLDQVPINGHPASMLDGVSANLREQPVSGRIDNFPSNFQAFDWLEFDSSAFDFFWDLDQASEWSL